MKRLELTYELFDEKITAHVTELENGINAAVFGGQLPHVGAVSIAASPGECHTTEFPGHRDSAVSRRWAESLCEKFSCPVVVSAGIHYDNLSREGIDAVLELSEEMLNYVIKALSDNT